MMARSPIVDHRGRPIDRGALTRELAAPALTSVRSVWNAYNITDLTPDKLARILGAAAQGDAYAYLTLAEEMEERELHYAGCCAPASSPWPGCR